MPGVLLYMQIRSGPRELLDIHPLELSFSLDSDKQIRCLVKLTNKTNECIAFHFKVTGATNKYCIEPAGRFLLPREMTYLVVTMETRGELQCNDQFLVESIIVREDRVTSKPIPGQTFDKMPISVVHKVKLAVIHVPAVMVREDRVTSKPIPGQTFDKMPISVVHKVKLPVIHVPAVQGTLNPQQSEGSQGKLLGRPNISDKDNEYTLVECLEKDLGYCAGKPIAAVLIYKCFVQWRTFESQTTSSFDRIIHLIGSALEFGFPRTSPLLEEAMGKACLVDGDVGLASLCSRSPHGWSIEVALDAYVLANLGVIVGAPLLLL
ncbi:vesicle-associated protein 2-2-like [Triticum aestivum]|uniref:vesicle-associated protein 2-2-like n=1 Tax=Triticum aestivum TaxID=4565 RepID=UPI001D00827A|nr:vesicle-associated protein 2-2-like [Triticum aestivum]